MITFKKILWPTDFSEESLAALKTANDLAVHFGAELFIMHAITDLPAMIAVPPIDGIGAITIDAVAYRTEAEKETKQHLRSLINTSVSKNLIVHGVVKHGYAAEEIIRAVNEEKIDLMVITTHGLTGFKNFIFGSVAEKVIKTATCPVLVIRTPKKIP